MIKVFISLFIFISVSLSFSQPVEIQFLTTGKICGEILMMEITNPNEDQIFFSLPPFYLPLKEENQAVIVPNGIALTLKPLEKLSLYLNGYTVFSDRKFPPKGKIFTLEQVKQYSLNTKVDFSDSVGLYGNYVPERFFGTKLISLDFIPTIPGSFELLAKKIDLNAHPEIASNILLSQSRMLSEGYERLFTAGKIVTHFNHDPVLEKNLMMQIGIWICAAGVEGKALKIRKLKSLITHLYKLVLEREPEKDFSGHIDSYIRLLDRMGKEGKVYIRPEDLDRKPQCLPPVVGLSAISDNVRTPTLSKVRYNEYEVRNQAMLGVKNDCMPCIVREDLKPALRNYLYSIEITKAFGDFTFLRNQLDSVALPVFVAQPLSYIDGMKNFNPRLWLADHEKDLNEILLLLNENARFYLDNIKKYSDNQQLIGVSSFISAFENDYLNLLNLTSEVFRFRESRYSFDCCELTKEPTISYLQLSELLEKFFMKYDSFLHIKLPQYVPLVFDSLFFNDFIIKGLVVYSEKALLTFFKTLTSDKQMICLEGPFPSERYSAIEKINAFLGTKISDVGTFSYGRMTIILDETSSLEFRFGECNCGKKRESLLPFPNLEPGNNHLYADKLKPLTLINRYEIAAFTGRADLSPLGASVFNGGGLSGFGHIPEPTDSIIQIHYGEKYWFSSPDSFSFDWFSILGLSGAFDLNEHIQFNISGSKLSGLALAKAGFHYLTNPLDSNSEKVLSTGIYTKINSWTIGGGMRYYVGNYLKIFAGANIMYHQYHGASARAFLNELEIEMNKTRGFTSISAGIEAGARYFFNQDFFIEFSVRLSKRFFQDNYYNKFTPDRQVLLGAGARF